MYNAADDWNPRDKGWWSAVQNSWLIKGFLCFYRPGQLSGFCFDKKEGRIWMSKVLNIWYLKSTDFFYSRKIFKDTNIEMKNWILKFDIRKKCGFAPLQSKCFRFDPWLFNWHEQCLSCDVNVGSCLLSTHGWQFELARQVPIAKIFLEKKKLLRKADVYLVEIGQHEKATWVAKSSCYYHQSKVVIINWHTILPWQFLSLVQRKKGRVACNNNGIDTDGDLRYRQNPMTQFTLYETWMTMMENG